MNDLGGDFHLGFITGVLALTAAIVLISLAAMAATWLLGHVSIVIV